MLVVQFCQNYGVDCFQGSLTNVAGRFASVLDKYQCDAFVRVNGDSPLMDHRLIDRGIVLFRRGDFDLVTNVFPRSFPKGQSVEVLRSHIFLKAYNAMQDEDEMEHITRYFYKHSERFNIHNFSSKVDYSAIQLSVDTPTDMASFEGIINSMNKAHWEYTLEDILALYKCDKKA